MLRATQGDGASLDGIFRSLWLLLPADHSGHRAYIAKSSFSPTLCDSVLDCARGCDGGVVSVFA